MHYLYRITNQINGKVYIGQAENYEHRWADHRRAVRLNKPTQIIHSAMIKYGLDNFEFEVIASCKSLKDANETETELVRQYDSFIKNGKGYNATLGGMNASKSEEWKAHMSSIKGGWIDREHTVEALAKMSKANLGRVHSEEEKLHRSQTMKEKCANGWMPVIPDNKGRKLGVSHRKGIALSKETKKKISENSKGRKAWNKISLSEQQVEEIRTLASSGLSLRKIAQTTHIHRSIIKRCL